MEQITFSLTSEDRARLKAYAAARHWPESQTVRELILTGLAAREDTAPVSRDIPLPY